MLSAVNCEAAGADGRSMLDEIFREGQGECPQRLLRPRLTPTWPSSPASVTRTVMPRDPRRPPRSPVAQPVIGAVEIRAPRVDHRRVERAVGA